MEINTKINKNLTLVVDTRINDSTYVDVYYDDKQVATLSYRNDLINRVELLSTTPRTLELMCELLIDNRKELDKWLEEVA